MIRNYISAIRAHQWVKNFLLFLPLILSHQFLNYINVINILSAFLAFSFVASSIYLVNDIFDIESDKKHPTKKFRPVASGAITIKIAYFYALVLFSLSLFISTVLNTGFLLLVIIYALSALVYSLYLKKIFVMDVLILSIFYMLRILAGALAIDVEITNWLLAFSLFFFLGLALVKRYIEMLERSAENNQDLPGRDYLISDQIMISIFGPACGLLSVLILMLYIAEQEAMDKYTHPNWLWGVTIILVYWIMRTWIIANRKQMHMDPIVFALKDKATYVMTILSLVFVYLAI